MTNGTNPRDRGGDPLEQLRQLWPKLSESQQWAVLYVAWSMTDPEAPVPRYAFWLEDQ